jgi:hypothetical protein
MGLKVRQPAVRLHSFFKYIICFIYIIYIIYNIYLVILINHEAYHKY